MAKKNQTPNSVKWQRGEVVFSVTLPGRKFPTDISFTIIHCYPEIFGFNLKRRVLHWIPVAENFGGFSDESLCDFINNVEQGLFAYTEKQYEQIIAELKDEESILN